jgi:hypothetical protein
MNKEIAAYNAAQTGQEKKVCNLLAKQIAAGLPQAEHKIWHGHPVWFLDGNPVAGYSKLKGGIRLLFWSGQSFDEDELQPEGTFKAADIVYTELAQVHTTDLQRWLKKAQQIKWDYKNIVKRKGKLVRLK